MGTVIRKANSFTGTNINVTSNTKHLMFLVWVALPFIA